MLGRRVLHEAPGRSARSLSAESSKLVAVIGGGPAGLMAAEVIATAGVGVVLYEQMPSVGRKFLLAGRGGLNLTHTEDRASFLGRYGAAGPRLAAAIAAFGPAELRAWCAGLGEETFVGSSGRVFPEGFRAADLLRKWRARLDALGVDIRLRTTWTGWDSTLEADALLLALGGASWPSTGSDGSWAGVLADSGIAVSPLRPANCGLVVGWSETFRTRFGGQPLKNVAASFADRIARGDVIVADDGLEGGPIYALFVRSAGRHRARGYGDAAPGPAARYQGWPARRPTRPSPERRFRSELVAPCRVATGHHRPVARSDRQPDAGQRPRDCPAGEAPSRPDPGRSAARPCDLDCGRARPD